MSQFEKIETQCPCGRRIALLIFPTGHVGVYACIDDSGRSEMPIVFCPTCGRDFSGLTADEVKENAWPT